jgi:serine/threonine protein kinase
VECLDDNAVSEFVSGSLPKSAVTKVEGHLAGCRDCRALVAALAQDAATDSNVETVKHERQSPSQVTELPKRTIGDRVGRYLILSTLGTGGMGVVFSAYDPQLDRKVALKLLRSGLQLATKDAQKRLRREAQAIAQLSHPNVVGVYDVGTDGGDLYIAMEFVEGETLTQWLKSYPRTWREIIDVFLQAAKGLVAAHGVGLLHRDFKPDNVLVGGDGRVRVTDFGLARSLLVLDEESARGQNTPSLPTALSSSLTATGTVLGTPRYMPPEQLTGPDIDARADQFSFCVALYEALYGAHPLVGNTSVAMLDKSTPAIPPPDGTKVPASIGRAIMRGLERDRSKRFPMISQLMAELIPPAPKFTPRVAAFAASTMVILLAGAVVFAMRKDPPPPTPPELEPSVLPDLITTINELKAEIKRLNAERQKLIEQLNNPPSDVRELRRQLTEKDEQILQLVKKVETLTASSQAAAPPRAPPRKPPSQSLLVMNAFTQADRDLDGCFQEWAERRDNDGNLHTDANIMVRMVVGPDGVAHSSVATGVESPSLRWCVESAIGRVQFPPGPDVLDLEVAVRYSGGEKNVSPRVVGQRKTAGSTLDLR